MQKYLQGQINKYKRVGDGGSSWWVFPFCVTERFLKLIIYKSTTWSVGVEDKTEVLKDKIVGTIFKGKYAESFAFIIQ